MGHGRAYADMGQAELTWVTQHRAIGQMACYRAVTLTSILAHNTVFQHAPGIQGINVHLKAPRAQVAHFRYLRKKSTESCFVNLVYHCSMAGGINGKLVSSFRLSQIGHDDDQIFFILAPLTPPS